MKTLKTKFTIVLTSSIFIVVIIFTSILYLATVVNNDKEISNAELHELAKDRPIIQQYLTKTKELSRVQEISNLIQYNQTAKYRQTLLISLPPILIISTIIAYAIATYLVKPIENVASSLKTIGSQNLSQRIPMIESSEEIELLIFSFNTLLDELEEAFKAQEQFIQDAAHELRTPLAAMKTNIEVFNESKTPDKKDYKKLVKIIEKLNHKLVGLNENLLLLNRKHKQSLNKHNSNIHDLIEDILESLSIESKKRKIKFKLNFSLKNPKIKIDPEKMSIAIKNIIENAIKYSKKSGGKIVISTEDKKESIKIKISDNGIGISEKDKQRIFDRFYRGQRGESYTQSGEGLGLSISKKFIAAHNGIIEVKSELNKGSEFIITLPT